MVQTSQLAHVGLRIVCMTFSCAALALLLHSPSIDLQPDAQLKRYAWELLRAIHEGSLEEYLLVVRKYPLVPVVLLALLYVPLVGLLLIGGWIPDLTALSTYVFAEPEIFNIVSRALPFAAAGFTAMYVWKVAQKHAVILLLSSITFVTYATAVRPHIFTALFTVMALFYSLQLEKQPTRLNAVRSFGSAFLAFCSLQSGLFAFVFPAWALRKDPRRVALWGALCAAGATVIGYPFVWRVDGFGVDLGHNQGLGFHGMGFDDFAINMIGTEPLLLLFALPVLIFALRTIHPALLLYCVAYVCTFGLYDGAAWRYFIPILPLLAIIGSSVLARAPRLLPVVVLCGVLLHVRFAVLALKPNTYEQAVQIIEHQSQHPIASTIPPYFLHTRNQHTTPVDTQIELHVRYAWEPAPNNSALCAEIAPTMPAGGFLWENPDWSLAHFLRAQQLGPGIRIYCDHS